MSSISPLVVPFEFLSVPPVSETTTFLETRTSSLCTSTPPVPYPPSPAEAKSYYYGINSRPLLVARSSTDLWVEPTGPDAHLTPKEITPVGWHPLNDVWETNVGPAMDSYLQRMGVTCTSLDPLRIGIPSNPSPPVIIWVGVLPGSLSANDGVHVALGCKSILTDNAIDDVHVEIRESVVTRSAKLYQPVSTSNPTVEAIAPFSTALGLSICAKDTPHIQGTAGLFFTDSLRPRKLYLLTARHIVFHPDTEHNELYEYHNPSGPHKKVLLMGNEAMERCIKYIESQIGGKEMIIDSIPHGVNGTGGMEEEEQKTALNDLKKLLANIKRDWRQPEQRILGHVVLSPPIAVNVGEEGYTEDWAVIEVAPSKVDATNFSGNAIDLGTTIPASDFLSWMFPRVSNPPSFKYPDPNTRLLRFSGTIPDNEMLSPNPNNLDQDNRPCIMVIKRGIATSVTVGRLQTIRSFTRYCLKDKPAGEMSKEVAVIPRTTKSGPFSDDGDSGSVVVDGKGRVAGLLTGGNGRTAAWDVSYVTSINFLLKRLAFYNITANILATTIV